jgi:hypothetical protein
MPLDPNQTLCLTDLQGRCLGRVSVERIERNQIVGVFTPESDFAAVRELFDELEAAVNDQIFGEADRISQEIDHLGLSLGSSDATEQLAVCDVQIMGVSSFCCQVPNLALTQVSRAVA